MEAIASKIGFIALCGMMVIAYAMMVYECTKNSPSPEKFKSYGACIASTFLAAFLTAAIISSPVYPGDEFENTGQVATEYIPGKPLWERDEIAQNVFFVLIIPALIAVKVARRESGVDKKPESAKA